MLNSLGSRLGCCRRRKSGKATRCNSVSIAGFTYFESWQALCQGGNSRPYSHSGHTLKQCCDPQALWRLLGLRALLRTCQRLALCTLSAQCSAFPLRRTDRQSSTGQLRKHPRSQLQVLQLPLHYHYHALTIIGACRSLRRGWTVFVDSGASECGILRGGGGGAGGA